MKTWRGGSSGWTGRLAALLFLVQALLIGFSLGATADTMPRDQFGNVICASGTTTDADHVPGKTGHHAGLLECCSFGCGMFAGPVAPPPTLTSLLVRQPLDLEVAFVLFEDVGSGAVETPRSTRGPPLSA